MELEPLYAWRAPGNTCLAALEGRARQDEPPEDYIEDRDNVLRVATKFVGVTKDYYSSLNREIEIIKLNGSIELAPILGLSDVIVDIVESGKTLRENHLKVLNTIVPVSARFIANRASYLFKSEPIYEMMDKLKEVLSRDSDHAV